MVVIVVGAAAAAVVAAAVVAAAALVVAVAATAVVLVAAATNQLEICGSVLFSYKNLHFVVVVTQSVCFTVTKDTTAHRYALHYTKT